MEAKSVRSTLHEALGASYTVNWLLLGFMGLGLIVGVAALGVVSARAVVERRQQIGVLRSIGFRRGMVQLSFLLESSFIALTAIVVGSALGLIVAYNVVADAADQPSWQGALRFVGAVGAHGDRLRRRLRRRAAHVVGPGRPRRARLPGGGPAV